MKGTTHFRDCIREYLDKRAATDALFAKTYAKPQKSLDDCITYILNQVKESGCCGFHQDEIFGMAVHYYDEDDIEVGKPIKCHVVVNKPIELGEEEKAEARRQALEAYRAEELARLKSEQAKPEAQKGSAKAKAKAQQRLPYEEMSLFDFEEMSDETEE